MRWLNALMILGALGSSSDLIFGQLCIAANHEPQRVFFGPAKNIPVIICNTGSQSFAGEIHARILQTSSAIAVRLGKSTGLKFQSLPGQTVMESVPLDFPPIKAETKFLVEWFTDTNHVIGETEVLVYPTNLLGELKLLLNGESLGLLDPDGALKSPLKKNGIELIDLEEMELGDFSGKLAIIGPFQSRTQMRAGLAQTIQRIARKGGAVVWIQPSPSRRPSPISWAREEIVPSFYVVPAGKGAVVIVQPDLVTDFSENPKSQLNLIYFCKLALNPAPSALPNCSPQP